MRLRFVVLVLGFALIGASTAQAHIALMSPSPRTASQKTGPCGADGSTRGPARAYKPGETITVEWDETVDHPGHYRISFNADGDEFPLPNNPLDEFPTTMVDQIEDRGGGGLYSQQITFPNIECDNCTLQLMQIMTVAVPYNSFYFQCSDIILSNLAPDVPDGGPGSGGAGPDAGGGAGNGQDAGDGSGGTGAGAESGGCSSSQGSTGLAGLLLLSGALVALRRRRLCRCELGTSRSTILRSTLVNNT